MSHSTQPRSSSTATAASVAGVASTSQPSPSLSPSLSASDGSQDGSAQPLIAQTTPQRGDPLHTPLVLTSLNEDGGSSSRVASAAPSPQTSPLLLPTTILPLPIPAINDKAKARGDKGSTHASASHRSGSTRTSSATHHPSMPTPSPPSSPSWFDRAAAWLIASPSSYTPSSSDGSATTPEQIGLMQPFSSRFADRIASDTSSLPNEQDDATDTDVDENTGHAAPLLRASHTHAHTNVHVQPISVASTHDHPHANTPSPPSFHGHAYHNGYSGMSLAHVQPMGIANMLRSVGKTLLCWTHDLFESCDPSPALSLPTPASSAASSTAHHKVDRWIARFNLISGCIVLFFVVFLLSWSLHLRNIDRISELDYDLLSSSPNAAAQHQSSSWTTSMQLDSLPLLTRGSDSDATRIKHQHRTPTARARALLLQHIDEHATPTQLAREHLVEALKHDEEEADVHAAHKQSDANTALIASKDNLPDNDPLQLLASSPLLPSSDETLGGSAMATSALLRVPPPSSSSDFSSWISAHLVAISKQRQLNRQQQSLLDRESKVHYLTRELATRDLLLTAYRKIVKRFKEMQMEQEEKERKDAASKINAQATADAIGLLQAVTPAAGQGSSQSTPQVDLSRYRDQLLSLIFGNKTLEQFRQEHEASITAQLQSAGAATASSASPAGGVGSWPISREGEEELFKLVREEGERGKSGAQQLLIESVMSIRDVDELDEADDQRGGVGGGGGGGGGGGDSLSSNASAGGGSNVRDREPATKLVDSAKNEYILSKPGSSESGKAVDVRLVIDLGVVIMAAALGGLLAAALKQPILLGYLLGGSVVGPGGLKLIGQFIQVETLAQFGATFLLFALGVEFSIDKLRRVQHVAVLGGLLQLLSMITVLWGVGVGLFDLSSRSAIFLGCVVSMSSTTVVVKSLMEKPRGGSGGGGNAGGVAQIGTLSGQVMLGLLIVQDVFLSVMLAMLNLARVPMDRLAEEALWLALRFGLLAAVVAGCMFLWPRALRLLASTRSQDLFLLGLIALCVFLTLVSEHVIHSAEVGAFLSGLLISSAPGSNAELSHRSMKMFAPIRDMFGALFFASIGMLINPTFLVQRAVDIAWLVLAAVMLKSLVTFLIVRLFGYGLEVGVRAGLGLSQIGEFAFVLASEGLRVGMLSKDLYFLMLGTTAVSILVTPAILKLSEIIVRVGALQERDKKSHAQGASVD